MRPRTNMVIQESKILRVIMLLILLISPELVAAEESELGWITKFCDQTAKSIYKMAWPSATFSDWQYSGFEDTNTGFAVKIRLNGISGLDDSNLYTDVVLFFDKDGFKDLRWGQNNGIIPPGATASFLLEFGKALNEEYMKSQQLEKNNERKQAAVNEQRVEPSFDCKLARTNLEIMICENNNLSKSDADMAALYWQRINKTAYSEDVV